MGSLQTEIQKTLQSWNAPVPTPAPAEKSIAQRVFEFVKDHPTCTSADVVASLGIDAGRSSATLLTLYQKGKLERKAYPNPNPDGKRDEVYSYWTAVDNFTDKTVRRVPKKPKKVKASTEKPVLFKEPKQFEMPRMKHVADEFNPEMFVQDLSLKQARAVYEVLKGYFSG